MDWSAWRSDLDGSIDPDHASGKAQGSSSNNRASRRKEEASIGLRMKHVLVWELEAMNG